MFKGFDILPGSSSFGVLGVMHIQESEMLVSSPVVFPSVMVKPTSIRAGIATGQKHFYGVKSYSGLCVPKMQVTDSIVKFGGFVFDNHHDVMFEDHIYFGAKKVQGKWKRTLDKNTTFNVTKEEAVHDVKSFLLNGDRSGLFAQLVEVTGSADDMYILSEDTGIYKPITRDRNLIIQLLDDDVKIIGMFVNDVNMQNELKQEVYWEVPEEVAKSLPIYNAVNRQFLAAELHK